MFRLFFWRLLCVLVLIAGILQLIGFFLPYALIVNTRTNTTVEIQSYWFFLMRFISGDMNYIFMALLSIFALFAILVSMFSAYADLTTRKPRVSSGRRLLAFLLAFFGLLEFLFVGVVGTAMDGFCVGNVCPLDGVLSSGFWPLLTGSLILAICLFLLMIL